MKKIVKFVILGLVLLAVAGGVYFTLTAPVSVPLTVVAPKTVELAITEQGVVRNSDIVLIYPHAQGPLLSINVSEGQAVSAGDVLCEIDPEALHLRMEELHGVIRGYEAQIRLAHSQIRSTNVLTEERLNLQNTLIEQNRRNVERAHEEFERMETLFELGVIPMSEVDAARTIVEGSRAALEASEQELSVIAAGRGVSGMAEYYQALIESTEATLAMLEREMTNYTVRATVSGVITSLPVKNSNVVSMTSPVAEITVPEDAIIEAFVSTQDLGSVRVGDTVELVLKRRDGDLRFPGRVSHIDSTAEIRLSALGVEERKVKTEIVPDMAALGGRAELGSGFDVEVRFILYREENKLAVPRTALFKYGGRDMLWIVRDGTAQMTEVALGAELRTETVVESGLAPNDLVITDANNAAIRNGVAVVRD